MDIPFNGLDGNDVTDDELAAHGLDFIDAMDVYDRAAKFFDQQPQDWIDRAGRLRHQPQRILMVGPDATGRLLTIVLELPDPDGISHVVTGYPAKPHDRTRYHHPGGRTRRR